MLKAAGAFIVLSVLTIAFDMATDFSSATARLTLPLTLIITFSARRK